MHGNSYNEEEIARICHETNRALQFVQNDPAPSQPWDSESDLLRETLINAVRLIRYGWSPAEMHEEWCKRYEEDGWTLGPVKDYVNKTHPCLVPYYDLPARQRAKTEVIRAIVIQLSLQA